jgi:serine/threonine-protein kinase
MRLDLHAELERPGRPASAGTGYLSVVAYPWAEVFLDGSLIGETPILRRSVSAGQHVVVVRNSPRGVEERRSVTITRGQEARISVDLTRQPEEAM